jgi:histidinol-phosphate aminotransferase
MPQNSSNPRRAASALVRRLVHRIHPYVPGEQPKIARLIKLNTNENPYPPSPKVLAAVRAATDDRLRLYPDPTAQPLRQQLARVHGCAPENIIVGNGSDELLAMAVRCFVDPAGSGTVSSRARVQFFSPSYSLYPVLAEIHGAQGHAVPLAADFNLPRVAELKRDKRWDFRAALTFVTTPNAPSGRGYRTQQLEELCAAQRGVIILDEAYVDFARENAFGLCLKYPHVLIARTFSKAYSLCFQRVGYLVGNVSLIAALHKIRDSYNVNGLGQVAALATLQDLRYYRAKFQDIIATRQKLYSDLSRLGFNVLPSETNFVLAKPPTHSAQHWLQRLRHRRILVRWFPQPAVKDYLRITIGTPREAAALVRAVKAELAR